ncbi:ribonuclease E/G-like protein, chloroplastic isoform X1 [Corylus avellana]|uniref:ribonuclease E/G-like protein, chloroplastic isoform X1 n=1 Tax=Corylus avellana TaxID=13451 RepID=UPI00286BE11D|nr:ribonuclease E/G-like protein, chloroplastic isoform X1 [Corylus avellana]
MARCPYSSTEVQAHAGWFRFSSMDLHSLPRRSTSFSSCSSSSLIRSESSLSSYICPHIPFGNAFRFTLRIGNYNCFRRSAIMTTKKGKSSTTLKELWRIVWTIEADLTAGQLLYITGDPDVLGSWDPEMAILMSPTEHTNLWKAEVKMAYGGNFKYNYFIKEETWPSCDIIWRPGPEFSISVPLPVQQDKRIMVRDSWMRFDTKKPPAQVWDSWIEETYLPIQSLISAPARDEDEIVKILARDSIESKPFLHDSTVKDILYSREDTTSVTHNGSNSDRVFTEKDQPVEEPWLLASPLLFPISKDKMGSDVSKSNDTLEDEVIEIEDKGNLLPEEGNSLISEEPISTVILINSSICTMQRIAVLEDSKLVELLLEPVKTNVQCDSVYLGVVTKLVPHMGGAFVNIGNSRHSLMDIKQNREPFIFPPFRQRTKKREINGSVIGSLEKHPTAIDNVCTSHDRVVIADNTEVDSRDDPVQSMHNDYEEHEVEDDFNISEVLEENVNGGILDYDEAEADFEDCLDRSEHHLEGETIDHSLPVDINGSNDSQMSHLQHMKDSRHMFNNDNKWAQVRKGTKIVVQVVKEGLGTKGPTLTAYPKLRSRFWILITCCDRIGISKKISGVERTRLKVIAKTLQPQGFGLTVRTVATGHSLEELQKDLDGLLSTWKNIMEHAKSAALAADEGVEGAIPVILHRAMGQTLSVVQDYFNDQVQRMVVDSPRTYHEVTNYLQEIAPDLCDRVELYDKRIPLFSEFNIEEEINNILSKRVPLANGGSLVIEQTEALVSIDVNGGHGVFGHGTSQEKAILDVNLAAAKQIARELRLRDIGGIIVVDFIDMTDDSNKRLVYEEVKKAVERDRSMVKVSELSRHGLMEITRKRVRPSVTFMISEPCTCCHATGRVEALETSFSKIEQEICQLLAMMDQEANPENPKSWPKFILRVDHHMCNYLTSGKRTRLAILSSSLKVWILIKVARGFTRGGFELKPLTDEKANKNQHQAAISLLRPTETRTNNPGKKVTLIPVKRWKTGGK